MSSHWVTQLHGVRSVKNGYLSYTVAKSKISDIFFLPILPEFNIKAFWFDAVFQLVCN